MRRPVTTVAKKFIEANSFNKNPKYAPEWFKMLKSQQESVASNVDVTLPGLGNIDEIRTVMIRIDSTKHGNTTV